MTIPLTKSAPPQYIYKRPVQVANCVLFLPSHSGLARHDASAKVDDAVAVAVAAVGAVVAVRVTSVSGFTSDDLLNPVPSGRLCDG